MSKIISPIWNSAKPPVALIAGPTASGKSDCAVRLALALRDQGQEAVIINADSAQVYADLLVLSARPSDEEMAGIPHVLFGEWDGATPCSAPDWAKRAKQEITKAHGAGVVPILVGGTGLYIRTLLEGIAPIPAIDPEIREATRALPVEQAYAALQIEDPDRAEILAPADSQRIARALEVIRATGHPLSHWHKQHAGGIADQITLAPLVLLPDREVLKERCDLRFELMMEQGALEEVELLIARELDPSLPLMRAIGVPELASFLREEISKEEAIAMGQLATRQYAKRQYTWLRNQLPKEWVRKAPENIDISADFEIILHK